MGSGIKQSNLKSNYRLIGVFASAAAYLTDLNKTSASEGDTYYDTTLDYQRSYNGSSWAPSGTSPIGPGSLDAAANIGTKITIDGAMTTGVEIEAADGNISDNGALLLLDNDDTGSDVHCLELTNAGTAPSLIITGQSGSDDIRGSNDTWAVDYDGVGTFTNLVLADSKNLSLGTSGDVTLDYIDGGTPGTAGAGLLIAQTVSDDNIQFGNATYSFDVIFVGETATTNYMRWDLNGGAGSVGALVFDNADIDLGDADLIRFGDSQDFTLGNAAGTPNVLTLTGDDQQFSIGTTGAGMDVYWYTENTGDYVYFDEDNALVDFVDVDLDLDDDAILRFGSSNDFTIQNIAGSPNVLRITGDDQRLDFGVSGGGFDMYWFTEDATNYILWDEDNSRMDMVDVDLRLDDDARLYFGSDADAYLVWDNSNSTIDIVGDISITGSLSISGAFDIGNFAFADDEELRFGGGNDFVFHYDSSNANLEIDAAVANDEITFGLTTATDIRIDGATYDIHWDASEDTLCFLDDAVLAFGNSAASPDIEIKWDQTRLNITGSGEDIRIGSDGEGVQVIFYGETSGADMTWAEAADMLLFIGGSAISLNDDVELLLGTGTTNLGDFKIYTDSTPDLHISEVSAAGKNLMLGEDGKGLAVRFFGDTSGRDLLWVQASDMLEFQDNAVLAFGSSSDVTIKWDTADLLIESAAEDTGEIKVGSTSAIDLALYGNTNSKIAKFNANTATLEFVDYDVQLQDDCILALGTSDDITLMWDQSRLIVDGVAADKEIRIGATNNQDIIIYGDTSTDYVQFDTSEEDIRTTGFDLTIQDDDILNFGTGNDITITWDKTRLLIDGTAADKVIRIGATNNQDIIIYGDTSTDLVTFDTSAELVTFNGFDLGILDTDILQFGDAGTTDCYMTWDTSRLQIVPSSNVFIGDKTNYVSISSAGAMTQTGTAKFTANAGAANFGGLILPFHATSSPSGAGGEGAVWFETDASKLWVNIGGTNWIGATLS